MESKTYGFPWKNDRFQMSLAVKQSAFSQKKKLKVGLSVESKMYGFPYK